MTGFVDSSNKRAYREPCEAIVFETISLVATLLDIVESQVDIVIAESLIAGPLAGFPIYRASAEIQGIHANRVAI